MQFICVTMLTILLLLYKTPKENVSFVIKRRYYEFIYIHKYQFSWFVKTLYFRSLIFVDFWNRRSIVIDQYAYTNVYVDKIFVGFFNFVWL